MSGHAGSCGQRRCDWGLSVDLTENWLRETFPDLQNIEKLGGGGQKLVYGAIHPQNGAVVIKLICPVQDTKIVEREILAVQHVGSARVPQILQHGRIATAFGDCYWIREQRISGETLRTIIIRAPLSPIDTIRLGRDVLNSALVQAEEAAIVHRDVKPENLMRDSNGEFWLLDFGIARHLTLDSHTATALPFGKMTLGYSPPEQCRNLKKEIDARADLFALGVTMYECAMGVNPFRAGTADPLEILRRVETDPLPLLLLPIKRPEHLRDFIMAITQKRRDHRPRTAKEASEWLGEICENEGI
jgi:serine/threonine protein kinase